MAGKNLVLHLLPKMPPANQTAVFFNHQYPWKESSDILDFLHRSNYQAKLASGTTCFGCGQLGSSSSPIVGFCDH